eukprot:m.173690 g.173690  ORF g.173690 m.173690 type:complete len:59 (-) comp15392_c0_seq5:2176-2352(-)
MPKFLRSISASTANSKAPGTLRRKWLGKGQDGGQHKTKQIGGVTMGGEEIICYSAFLM